MPSISWLALKDDKPLVCNINAKTKTSAYLKVLKYNVMYGGDLRLGNSQFYLIFNWTVSHFISLFLSITGRGFELCKKKLWEKKDREKKVEIVKLGCVPPRQLCEFTVWLHGGSDKSPTCSIIPPARVSAGQHEWQCKRSSKCKRVVGSYRSVYV